MNRRSPSPHVSRARFAVASAAAFATIGLVRAPGRAAQFEFKCASNLAVDHPLSIRMGQMWNVIEQESGGRVHTGWFPNSELGGDAAMLAQLRSGALQFFAITGGNLAAVVPVADISYLGFAFQDEAEALRTMNGPAGNYVRQETNAKGMYALRGCWGNGMNHVSSSLRAVRQPDDLHGFKIRVALSKILLDLFKTLGASPTPISTNELYSALQTKIVDGEATPLSSLEASKRYEVQKFVSLTRHSWTGQWLIANQDVWKTVPPDLQELIERNSLKYSQLLQHDMATLDTHLQAQLTGQGLAFNNVNTTPFRSLLPTYYQTWKATFGPTAWSLMENALHRKLG